MSLVLDATTFHRRVPSELWGPLAEWMEARCEGRPVLRAELLDEGRMRCWAFLRGFYEHERCDDTVWLDTHRHAFGTTFRDSILIERCFYISDQPPPALLAAFFPPPAPPSSLQGAPR